MTQEEIDEALEIVKQLAKCDPVYGTASAEKERRVNATAKNIPV